MLGGVGASLPVVVVQVNHIALTLLSFVRVHCSQSVNQIVALVGHCRRLNQFDWVALKCAAALHSPLM